MPTSTRMGHVRFYETLLQTRNCPTGGQGRPPLQGCYEVAGHCAILQLHSAGESAASTPTDVIRGCRSLYIFAIAYRAGGVEPRPYGE